MSKLAMFDLDDTLCHHSDAVKEGLIKLSTIDEDLRDLNLFCAESNDPHIKERMELIRKQPGWWRSLKLNTLSFNLWVLALQVGFECHVLTQGPRTNPAAWGEKVQWVNDNLGDKVPIHIVRNKGLIRSDILVDDYPKYCELWLAGNPQGNVIMPERSYNKDFKHERVVKYTGNNFAMIGALLVKWVEQ